jgi:hypothetical protein
VVLTISGEKTFFKEWLTPEQVAQHRMLHLMGVPCFADGTRMLTPQGKHRFEQIVVGDLVMTATGAAVRVL